MTVCFTGPIRAEDGGGNAPVDGSSGLPRGLARSPRSAIRVGWWADLSREMQTAGPDLQLECGLQGRRKGNRRPTRGPASGNSGCSMQPCPCHRQGSLWRPSSDTSASAGFAQRNGRVHCGVLTVPSTHCAEASRNAKWHTTKRQKYFGDTGDAANQRGRWRLWKSRNCGRMGGIGTGLLTCC